MAWSDKLADMLRLNDGEQAYVGYPQMQVGLNKPRQAGYSTGFLEGATGMDSMQPKNPITDHNFESYEQGKNTGEAVGIGAMALPAYAMALRVGAPKAYNALENYMVKSGGMIPLEAYHGTPHTIEGAFSATKGGTGQGTQNFGHGTYFAENPTIAQGYATSLSKPKIEINGKPITEFGVDEKVATHSPSIFKNPLDYGIAEYRKSATGQLLDYPELHNDPNFSKNLFNQRIEYLRSWGKGTQEAKAAEAMQNFAEKHGIPEINAKGNLYKVDIPDEKIPNMLNWYENVPEDVRKRISAKAMEEFGSGISPSTGEQLYKEIVFSLKQAGSKNPQADASKWLADQGVTGVKYENFQIKKGQGGGTHNYVVFEPSDVQILEKNGMPNRKEILEQLIDKQKQPTINLS